LKHALDQNSGHSCFPAAGLNNTTDTMYLLSTIKQRIEAVFTADATPTPPLPSGVPNAIEVIPTTPIDQRTVESPSNPEALGTAQLVLGLYSALQTGADEATIKGLLKEICKRNEIHHMDLRNARQKLGGWLHQESEKKIKRYEQGSQIKRHGYQDPNKYQPFYSEMETTRVGVEKYKAKRPEDDLQYAKVSQDTLIKALFVLNELILDNNKINANNRKGCDYGPPDFSVVHKPEAVDEIFADADAVFAGERKPFTSPSRPTASPVGVPTTPHPFPIEHWVLSAQALTQFTNMPFKDLRFSDAVSGIHYPALGTKVQIVVSGKVVNVKIDWHTNGALKSITCGNPFDGYSPVPAAAVVELERAGILAPAPKE